MAQLTVMDPVAQLAAELGVFAPAAERPRSIERLRVGLYWNRKPGGNWALEHVGKLLTDRFSGAEAFFLTRGGLYRRRWLPISGRAATWWWAQRLTEGPARRTLRTT